MEYLTIVPSDNVTLAIPDEDIFLTSSELFWGFFGHVEVVTE